MTSRYIMRSGNKIELTFQDELMLERQSNILTAQNAIEIFSEFMPNGYPDLDDNTLAEIGEEINSDVYSNMGDREFDVLLRWGIIETEGDDDA